VTARRAALLVALVTLLVFLAAVGNGFVNWDDDVNLTGNPWFRGFGADNLRWMFTTTLMGHYIPLTWLTFAADQALWGLDPRGYHLTSVALHALNAALVFLVARRLLGGERVLPAAVAALAFALHPLRVESVAWATERRDVLSGAFALSSLLAYFRSVDDPDHRRRWLGLSLAAFAGALLSKAIAMTLPLILVAVDVHLRRVNRRALLEKLPFACLAVVGAAIALVAQWQTTMTPWSQHGALPRTAMVAYSMGFYASRTALPIGLSPLYELPAVIHPLEVPYALSALGTLAMTLVAVALRRRVPGLLLAWVAYVVMVLPISGAVHAGHQLVADRYSYLACVPWALLAGAGIAWILDARRPDALPSAVRVATVTSAIALLGAWTLLTTSQIPVWRDSETLWRTAVDHDPACSVCRTNLGRVFLEQGHLEAAAAEFRLAIAARPERANPHNNLGTVLYRQGRVREAFAEFQLAAALQPHFADPHNNLGVLYAGLGQVEEAMREFSTALALRPEFPVARSNLERVRSATRH
jgi:hypothetical protein